jgi:hypothetical protein
MRIAAELAENGAQLGVQDEFVGGERERRG